MLLLLYNVFFEIARGRYEKMSKIFKKIFKVLEKFSFFAYTY